VRTSGSYVSDWGCPKGFHFFTHIEADVWCALQYTKIYGAPVIAMERDRRSVYAVRRYLDFGIQYNYLEYEKYMLSARLAHEKRFERGCCPGNVGVTKLFAGGFDLPQQDRFCFCNLLQVFVQEKYLPTARRGI